MRLVQIIFSAVLTLVAMNAFTTNTTVFILPVIASVYFVLRYCDFCAAKNPKLYFGIGVFVVISAAALLALITSYDITFELWLYANVSESIGYTANSVIVFIVFCFFIPSGVYYFTSVLYRPVFLLLIIFISYLLNDQRTVDVPVIYMALTTGAFFAILIIYGGSFEDAVMNIKKRYIIYFTTGVFICAAISTQIFNFSENRAAWTQSLRDFRGMTGLFGYSNASGINDQSFLSDRILFLVNAEEPLYFVRQSFGPYYNNRWYTVLDDSLGLSFGPYNWEDSARSQNIDRLIECIAEAADAGYFTENTTGLKEVVRLARLKPADVETPRAATIIPQGISTQYVLAPIRTFGVDGLPEGGLIARNALDEIFIASSKRLGTSYTISYYSETFRRNPYLIEFAQALDTKSFQYLLGSLVLYYQARGETVPQAVASIATTAMQATVFDDYSNNQTDPVFTSERLIDLVADITQDMESDYEKAAAIEKYFSANGFVYNLDYPKEINDDIELFIFDKKTGICGHYATAMTIMARIAGLNARYVEGFVGTEQNRNGTYVVRAKNAHAFVQVYIAGYGWVTFDPTVSSSGGGDTTGTFFGILVNYVRLIFSVVSVLIVVFAGAFFVYTRVVTEIIFVRRAAKSDAINGITMIYKRVLKIARQQLKAGYNIGADYCAQFVYEQTGVNISVITDNYNTIMFGDASAKTAITPDKKQEAIKAYKALKRYLNRQAFQIPFIPAPQ